MTERSYASDVAASLVSSIGAYIRALSPSELPKDLRRFRSFQPRTLLRHSEALLATLENDVERARLLEWVERDRPPLGRRDAELLRIAAERDEGWEDRLASLSTVAGSGTDDDSSADLESAVARERARVRAAREEARKIKRSAREALADARQRGDEAERRARTLQIELSNALDRAAAAEASLRRSGEEVQRERRRSERALRRLRTEQEVERAELKEARKRLRELERLLEKPGAVEPVIESVRRKSPSRPPKRRAALAVPKGLYAESPKTLESWLSTPNVHLLVDGYNVAMDEGGYVGLDLEGKRARLVEEVDRLARRRHLRATIVFDGGVIPPGRSRRSRTAVEVQYSRPPEIADDHLVALLGALPNHPVVVATSDRELQERCRALGATIATSPQLLALL